MAKSFFDKVTKGVSQAAKKAKGPTLSGAPAPKPSPILRKASKGVSKVAASAAPSAPSPSSSLGSTVSKGRSRPKRRTPPTPQQKARRQIQRRVLAGKSPTKPQIRLLDKTPKLERKVADARLTQLRKPIKAELGIKKVPETKVPRVVIKQVARGKGEAKLVKAVAKQLPKKPPPKAVRRAVKRAEGTKAKPREKRRPTKPRKTQKTARVVKRALGSIDDPNARALAPAAIKAARKTGVPASVLLALSGQESGYGTNTGPSSAGARGVTQFIPSTRETMISEHGVDPWKDAKSGMLATGIYLNELGFDEDPQGALSGYSGGYAADAYNNPILEGAQEFKKLDKAAAAKGAKVGKVSGGQPQKAKGAWAGSKAKINEVLKGVVDKSEYKDDKRTPEENAAVGGAEASDHLTTSTNAFAADLPASDEIAQKIAKKLGMASHVGTNEVTRDGYRYQLIWQDAGHYDHVHLGVQWTGESAPPGTMLGGPVSSAPSTGTSSGGGAITTTATATGTAGTAASSSRKKKRKKPKKPVRVPSLSAVELPDVDFTPSEEDYSSYLKRKSASVSL